MIIRHSLQILEQLSEVEHQIKQIERMMEGLGLEADKEKLAALVLACRKSENSRQTEDH